MNMEMDTGLRVGDPFASLVLPSAPSSLQVAPMWAARKLQHEHRRILPCGNTIGHYLAEAFNTRESRFVF